MNAQRQKITNNKKNYGMSPLNGEESRSCMDLSVSGSWRTSKTRLTKAGDTCERKIISNLYVTIRG